MLKFKGQTELGTWVEFNISQIGGVAGDYIAVYIHHDYTVFVNPDTIQLADDPRKAMLAEIRKRVYKYSYADWHRMLMEILDEMEVDNA